MLRPLVIFVSTVFASARLAPRPIRQVGKKHQEQLSGDNSTQVGGGGVPGGVDFTACVTDPDTGFCCVDKLEQVKRTLQKVVNLTAWLNHIRKILMFHNILQTTTIEKDPILECTHKNREQCHYTYVTQFTPSQEEVTLIELNGERRGRGKLRGEDLFSVFSVCRSHKEYTDLPFHQVCEENFEKDCQLTFKQQAYNETVSLITA